MPMELTDLLASELTVTANPLLSRASWFTNSMLVTVIVTVLVVIWARRSTAKMTLVPNGVQNLFEAVVETLYVTFEGIVGKHMIPKVFSLIATLFVFILTANWFGLVPGVGTIGFGEPGPGPLGLKEVTQPLLRPANADLNMTLGMALFFMAWWLFWTIQEVGVIGFLKHIFAPKGDLKGALWYVLLPAFRLCWNYRSHLDSNSAGFALIPVVREYLCRRDAVAHHVIGGGRIAAANQLDLTDSISASVLLSRAVGGSAPSLRFCNALRRLYQALDRT